MPNREHDFSILRNSLSNLHAITTLRWLVEPNKETGDTLLGAEEVSLSQDG